MKYLILYFALLICACDLSAQKKKPAPVPPVALESGLYSGLKWRCIGPFQGGRSLSVSGVPDQPLTYYMGATGGGVWKTEDGGDYWYPISDGNFTSASVGALAVAPSDPNVIYVGMGEAALRNTALMGDGLYKSEDAGKTWKQVLKLDASATGRIAIHPTNPDIAYAAVMGKLFDKNDERGLYRTTNGGQSWSKILAVNDSTGCKDVDIDPVNPNNIYCTFWQVNRKPWKLESGGQGSGLYKSSDGGNTWKKISENPGLPRGVLGKVCMAVSPSNPSRVFAMIESKAPGLYRSDDYGENWILVSASNDITQRPWYFSEIFCDPQDENTIYACNLELMKSIDGGQNFKSIPQEHGDCHDLWINPDNPDNYICGYDGSAVITFTDGLTWTDMKIPTAQFYHVNLDDDFPVNAYGGQQDWGSVRIATRSYGGSIGERDWRYVAGGEAGYIVPKPGNSNITFGGEYNGIMSTLNTDNEQETFVSVYPYINDGWGADTWKYRFAWTYPIVFSPWNSDVLYCTSNHVHRSTNGGASWETISHDLTRDDPQKQLQSGGVLTPDNTGAEVYCTIYAFAESTVQQGLLWAGSDDGLVHVSKDNGKTWLNVTPTSLPEWSTVNIIEPSRFDAGVCYLAAHRYRLGDTRPLLYKTTDFGQTWQQITDGLPANVYTRCIREDNVRKGLLYCGTETGVYFSINDGVRWYSLSNNLPVTPVWDLRVNTVDNALVIATHGRSMWVLDDIGPLRELQPELSRKDVHFFQPTPAWRMDGYQISENRLRSMRLKEGTNAPSGALFYYYLRQSANDELRMVIYNARGDSIIGFSDRVDPYGEPFDEDGEKFYSGKGTASAQLTNKSGMHRFVWDLRYPDAKSPSENFWAEDQLRGPLALPGTYKARLFKGKEMIGERTFEIRLNPEVPTSDEDLLAQFDLCLQLNRKQDEISAKIRQLKAVRQQTEGFMSGFSETTLMPELQKIHRTLMDSLDAIEGELYNPEIETYLDPLRYPYELFEKYGSLSDFIHAGDNRPTQQMVEVFDELNKECARLYQRIDQVYSTLVPQFNAMVDQMKLNVVDPQRAIPKEK